MAAKTTAKQGLKHPVPAKKPKKETLKQVLASPFSSYWPLISDVECKTLAEAFDNCLPTNEQKKVEKPHWNLLKTMTKEQRKQFQLPTSDVKKHYAFGVNEVTKLIEKSTIHAVLVASDVNPRLLVKHVLDMCVIKNVPVLVVPGLREILLQRTGLSGVVFGAKNNDLLAQIIRNIYVNHPVPENHIHYFRMLKNEEKHFKSDSEIACTEMEQTEREVEEQDESVYLYRTSKNERVFKPESAQNTSVNAIVKSKQDIGFLSLETKVVQTTQKPNYKALIVKRLKGNKEREKRKREMIKGNKDR